MAIQGIQYRYRVWKATGGEWDYEVEMRNPQLTGVWAQIAAGSRYSEPAAINEALDRIKDRKNAIAAKEREQAAEWVEVS